MKLTYLGTAAAEGFPAVFCNCGFCKTAKTLGGKNIRTRSQSIINDDLLLDLPADTYHHFLQNGLNGHKIRYLFITHSHSDHFYPNELMMRHGAYAHDMQVPILKVFCGQGAYLKLKEMYKEPIGFEINLIKPYETIQLDGYEVTALPARHFPGDGALFYVIKGEKTVLYAHDTGFFYDEVFDFISKENYKFDLISLDCTNVDIPISDAGHHMGIPNIKRLLARLYGISAIDDNTVKIINHFSHNAEPLHDVLETKVKDLGLSVSFDKMTVSF